ncbi:MAG: CheR family methyltransferase [Candidatus Brocadia sp.]
MQIRLLVLFFSGTGTDGTLGLKAIKGAGGMSLVQEIKSAEFSGMPISAIASGCIDRILPADEMPDELIRYIRRYYQQGYLQKTEFIPPKKTNDMEKVFGILQQKTGHNFTHYRYSTVSRRIGKRMSINHIETLTDYVVYLQQHPSEVEALFKELTIGVTKFFRDSEVYKAFKEKVIPHLFEHQNAELTVRVWVAGCSTGEEAYSLAILLADYMDVIKRHFKIQIFATDIDPDAINFARAGIYPENIIADVPRELMKYFISRKDYTFVVDKRIREMVIFASHNLIKDPPFSKLDLVSCRNLLIYLEPVLQRKLIPLFHYILNPKGFLILGSSENVGEFTHLFSVVDKKCKIFQRKGTSAITEAKISVNQLTGNIAKIRKVEEFMKTKEISISEITKNSTLFISRVRPGNTWNHPLVNQA